SHRPALSCRIGGKVRHRRKEGGKCHTVLRGNSVIRASEVLIAPESCRIREQRELEVGNTIEPAAERLTERNVLPPGAARRADIKPARNDLARRHLKTEIRASSLQYGDDARLYARLAQDRCCHGVRPYGANQLTKLRCFHEAQERVVGAASKAFIREEEEKPVADNRAAQAAAKRS